MSVDQAPARRTTEAKVVRYHDYIDEKIESTRRMVKVVDLTTSLVELAVAVLLFLLLSVVVEHWLVPGGFPVAVRASLFAVLVAGGGYFAVRRLWPLCVHAINPVYAAQTIEHGSPGLKNGLINLLLFRQRRTEISDAVYRTLEEQAAHGLTRAPIDTAVDRSELIRLGYVLLAVVAVVALYKVLSPKDPLIAAERVLMPWADIVPASRVTITDITPGATTISRGELVDVSAEVHGLGEDENAVLRYSTEDGRIVGRAIPLKASRDGLRFNAQLADESEGGPVAGVSSNLTYHLEAGDARSLDYAIKVVPAATILVESVDYHYPPYTGYVDKSVKGIGDIRAIEGTRVTVHARANGKIQEANVDFDADGRLDLQMSAAENQAKASFDLGLRDDRQTPLHASYVLRFKNDEGRENHGPVKHSINVDPDLKPEAEIRSPQEKVHDARLNEGVTIEVEASDPDFVLGAVRLRGETAGQSVVDEKLLGGMRKRFNGRYVFTPAAHGLKAGDVLEYWVEADDNRSPKPNTTMSEHRSLRIVSPNPAPQPPPNQIAKNDRQPQQPQQGDGARGNDKQNGQQNQGDQGGNSGEQQSGGQNGQSQQGKDSQGQQSQGNGQGQGQGQGDKSQGQGDKSQSGNSGGEQQSGGGSEKNQSGEQKQNQTGSGQGEKANRHDGQGEGSGQSSSGDSTSNQSGTQDKSKQPGASSGGQQPKDGAQPSGAQPNSAQPDSKQNNSSQGGNPQSSQSQKGQQQKGQSPKGDQQSGSQEEQTPVSTEGDNDAEAFSRIQKHMEQKGELKPEENSASGEQQPGAQNQSGQKQGDQKQAGEQQKNPGDKEGSTEQGKSESPKDKQNGAEHKPSNGNDSAEAQGEKKQDGKSGQGAETRGDDSHKKGEPKSDSQAQQHSPGGEQSASKGSAGAGNEEKSQGAPNSKPEMKPTDKPEQSSSNGNKSEPQEPPAGANGKRESDSHGEQGGDKAGGGKEGGGQKSPHDGTGSTGQNQSADNGAGESGEKGKGDNSPNAGHDAKSDHPTGASDGKTPGNGSQQRDGSGDKAGGKQGEEKTGKGSSANDGTHNANGDESAKGDQSNQGDQGDKSDRGDKSEKSSKQGSKNSESDKGSNKSENQPGDKRSGEPDGKQGGDGSAGGQNGKSNQDDQIANHDNNNSNGAFSVNGQPGGGANPQPSSTGEAPEGDAANLEYTRKQTDLVVDKLANQLNRKEVDKGMLKELGWSEAELKRFVERWQQRKAAAEKNDETGEAAKKELDDALRSLGLRRGALQQNAAQKDTMRDLHEGYHGPVPAEYKDRLRAYNQGVSRVHQDGE